MIPPHELKNREFTKVLRGYSSVEVDEHIDFIIEKYTEIYRENDELERKLKLALAEVETLKTDEESIRSALVNAQRASANIIAEANERADLILRSAKNNCDKIIVDFRSKIKKERDTLYELRRTVEQFKTDIFTQYQQHITYLQEIAPDADDSAEWQVTDDEYVKEAVRKVKTDVAAGAEKITAKLRSEEEVREKTETAETSHIVNRTLDAYSGETASDAPVADVRIPEAEIDDTDDGESFDHAETETADIATSRKSISVKDTIKELNRKFMSDGAKGDDNDHDFDSEQNDRENDTDELLDLLDDED